MLKGSKALTTMQPSIRVAAKQGIPMIHQLLSAKGRKAKANVAKNIGKSFVKNTAHDMKRRLGAKQAVRRRRRGRA